MAAMAWFLRLLSSSCTLELFYFFYDFFESIRIGDGNIGEDFAVKIYFCVFEFFDKCTVF